VLQSDLTADLYPEDALFDFGRDMDYFGLGFKRFSVHPGNYWKIA
jgi:hypothetical protein